MNPVMNPFALRAAFLLFGSVVAFGLGLFLMRQLRRYLVSESESMDYTTSTFSDQSSEKSSEQSSDWRKDNHMKHTKQMAIVTFLMAAVGIASAQSLGDYARTARKNKVEPSPTTRHYDNDNLPTHDSLSVVGPPATVNPTAPANSTATAPPEVPKPAQQPAAADPQKAADAMNKKIQEQQDKINSLNRELDLDQREQRLRAASYYTDAGTRLRNPGQWDKDQAQDVNDAAEKRKTLDAARQQLEQMQEEARKAGISQKEKDADPKQQ